MAYMYHCSNLCETIRLSPNEENCYTVPNLLVGTVRLSPVVAADSAIVAVAAVAVAPGAESAVPVEVAVESASTDSLSWHPPRNLPLPPSRWPLLKLHPLLHWPRPLPYLLPLLYQLLHL